MDAPTQAGGVSPLLRDPNACTVLDVGGDYIGARAVGWYAPCSTGRTRRCSMCSTPTAPGWRPSSKLTDTGEDPGGVPRPPGSAPPGQQPQHRHGTTAQEFLEGHRRVKELVEPYRPIRFASAAEELCPAWPDRWTPLFPLHLYFSEPWLNAGGPLEEGA